MKDGQMHVRDTYYDLLILLIPTSLQGHLAAFDCLGTGTSLHTQIPEYESACR
jgi:hypothetical protein